MNSVPSTGSSDWWAQLAGMTPLPFELPKNDEAIEDYITSCSFDDMCCDVVPALVRCVSQDDDVGVVKLIKKLRADIAEYRKGWFELQSDNAAEDRDMETARRLSL